MHVLTKAEVTWHRYGQLDKKPRGTCLLEKAKWVSIDRSGEKKKATEDLRPGKLSTCAHYTGCTLITLVPAAAAKTTNLYRVAQ